jgi:hypothetical protein
MSTTAADTRKLVADLGGVLWDVEDRLLDGDVPDELLAALVAAMEPCKARLQKFLAALAGANRVTKKAPPPARNGKAKPKRACSAAARR